MVIPYGVTKIGRGAFGNCLELAKLTIPRSVERIEYNAFIYTPFKEIVFQGKTEDEVEQMEDYPWGIIPESAIKCEP